MHFFYLYEGGKYLCGAMFSCFFFPLFCYVELFRRNPYGTSVFPAMALDANSLPSDIATAHLVCRQMSSCIFFKRRE